MSLNISMAYHAGDKEQVARWLAWVEELGGIGRHKLFLMPARGQAADFKTSVPFTVLNDDWAIPASDWSANNQAVRDASAPNSMVRQFAWHFHLNKLGPWLFCEPDCIPTREGWADELEDEYRKAGKPFMGARVKVPDVDEHATGNMIFHQDAAAHCKLLMLPVHAEIDGRRVELAFDVAAAPDILPHLHETKLIQHVFRGAKFETADHLARLDPSACLFHTDKDGGLIRLLREKKNANTAPKEQQNAAASTIQTEEASQRTQGQVQAQIKPRVHTYFRPCVDTEALAEQKRILAIWEKNWREAGWEPVILTEAHAREHPQFAKYHKAFTAMPTVSPKEYEMACLNRWTAMTAIGGGMLVDYDVLTNGYEFSRGALGRFPTILSDNNPVPCAVVGTAEQYQNAIDAFVGFDQKTTEKGKPHVSDMLMVQALKFPAFGKCVECGTKEWDMAELIHFSHRSVASSAMKKRSELMEMFVSKDCGQWQENPEWHMASHNADLSPRELTSADCIKALVAFSKKDGFAKGRIVKQLRKAGLIPKK